MAGVAAADGKIGQEQAHRVRLVDDSWLEADGDGPWQPTREQVSRAYAPALAPDPEPDDE